MSCFWVNSTHRCGIWLIFSYRIVGPAERSHLSESVFRYCNQLHNFCVRCFLHQTWNLFLARCITSWATIKSPLNTSRKAVLGLYSGSVNVDQVSTHFRKCKSVTWFVSKKWWRTKYPRQTSEVWSRLATFSTAKTFSLKSTWISLPAQVVHYCWWL